LVLSRAKEENVPQEGERLRELDNPPREMWSYSTRETGPKSNGITMIAVVHPPI
jgi:hypothetical protein